MRHWRVCALLVLVACPDPARVREMGRGAEPGSPLVPMPPRLLEECRRFEEVRPACPARVPVVDDETFRRGDAFAHDELQGFFVQWNAPYEGLDPRNAPPRFAHLNVYAGDLGPITGFGIDPADGRSPHVVRDYGLGFGPRSWNGRRGELYLAPSYGMGGGSNGDHLVFEWEQDGREYAVSLHAWDRLDEAEAVLKAIVESLPPEEDGT